MITLKTVTNKSSSKPETDITGHQIMETYGCSVHGKDSRYSWMTQSSYKSA